MDAKIRNVGIPYFSPPPEFCPPLSAEAGDGRSRRKTMPPEKRIVAKNLLLWKDLEED